MLQSVCGWLSSSQDPLGWGRILPSVARGNGCKAGLLPPSWAHCNDFGVPWGATRLLGAEGTVQPCCHSSPVPRGSVVSPGGDRCCAKATWILCPPRVRSRTQSLNAQDLCWAGEASFPPLLPFLLLRNSGQGCTGRLADGAPPFRDLITPTSPPSPPGWPEEVVAIPKPVSPRGPMVLLPVAVGWFDEAKSSWGAGPCCPCVPFPALGTPLNYT